MRTKTTQVYGSKKLVDAPLCLPEEFLMIFFLICLCAIACLFIYFLALEVLDILGN